MFFLLPAAIPALIPAAEFTAGVLAVAIGAAGVSEMVNQSDRTKDKEKTDAKAVEASSAKPCKKCPAIAKVTKESRPFTGKKKSQEYQQRICRTKVTAINRNGYDLIEEFIFRDPRLRDFKGRESGKNEVDFDGWEPEWCLFLEAKGEYDQFFDKNGKPKSWFNGIKNIVDQACRHQQAIDLCDKIPWCHWHFMQPLSHAYYKKKFIKQSNITVYYTP